VTTLEMTINMGWCEEKLDLVLVCMVLVCGVCGRGLWGGDKSEIE
jgi:hypothetical protein